jgi:hypothetical protein
MTQVERDRLVTLKKASRKQIAQRKAGEDLGVSGRHVRRLLQARKERGDMAVIYALRGGSGKDLVGPGGRRVRAGPRGRALGQETRHRSEQRDGAPVDGPWQSSGAPSSFRLGDQQEVSRICHELSD